MLGGSDIYDVVRSTRAKATSTSEGKPTER